MFRVTIEDLNTGEKQIQTGLLDVAVAGNVDTPLGCNPWWLAQWRNPAALVGPTAALLETVRVGCLEYAANLAVAGRVAPPHGEMRGVGLDGAWRR